MSRPWYARTLTALAALLLSGLATTPAGATPGRTGHSPGFAAGHAVVADQVARQTEHDQPTTFFVLLKSRADLSRVSRGAPHADRVNQVYQTKKSDADRSQAGLRALLTERKADFTPYWIANAIRVTGGKDLVRDIASRPEVERIVPDRSYPVIQPVRSAPAGKTTGVEWNVDRVRAPEVWSTFGDRGDGVVVGTIDTGAQFDHPAIARQYRGAERLGVLDHEYSWYDPAHVCGNPSVVPCDNVGHGTHVLGTILGDDGQGNQTGVAPGAKWIAAKGCESNSCSTASLLAAGQWMTVPTDFNGNNPRPDLAPNVINNSWGGDTTDPFFQQTVDTWVAAGIFPVFANGNSGPGCATAHSPGDYLNSYAVGAFDENNVIADFSSRGPGGINAEVKPEVAAPGVNIRSSVPGGGYAVYSGTSMATPHVVGAVALVWAAAPALRGDVAATAGLLNGSAVAVDDRSCGGTATDNNVWGHGRLDTFAAVSAAPRGPTGTLAGTVRGDGQPLVGAQVQVEGPTGRSTSTDDQGRYTVPHLPVGQYAVTARIFGRLDARATVTITENTTTTQDLDLAPAPRHTVSGHVRDSSGAPVAGTAVSLPDTPLPAVTTDADGAYRVPDVPEGTFDLVADRGRCWLPERLHVAVAGDTTADVVLPVKTDAYGHVCATTSASWVPANTVLSLQGDDASVPVPLPFPVNLYGQSYQQAHVTTNGFLSFTSPNAVFINTPLPTRDEPNTAIYAFWDDLVVDQGASVRTEVLGSAPNRQFVVEWRDVRFLAQSTDLRVSFEIVLSESGRITLQYHGIGAQPVQAGDSATVGIENETGTDALEYSFNRASLADDTAIVLRVPGTGLVRGTVTDANDGSPVPDAVVTVTQQGQAEQTVRADTTGGYQARIRVGSAHLRVAREGYGTDDADVTVSAEDGIVPHDVALRSGRLTLGPDALEVVVPPGQTRQRTLTVGNTGTAPLNWQAREAGGGAVRQARAVVRPNNTTFDTNAYTTRGLPSTGDAPRPASPGQVLRSWPVTGLQMGWGVGRTDSGLWISDPPTKRDGQFHEDGGPGQIWNTPWAGNWAADMAQVPGRNLVCQVNVGGDNGIYCWNPATGEVAERIVGNFPWATVSQRGLAYRADDDSFYVGGWNQGIVYHVQGLSHPDRGAVIGQCSPADPAISGLAWNNAHGMLWEATNSANDTIYGLNPDTCQTLRTIGPPDTVAYSGGGLETDLAGNLWTVSQGSPSTAYLIDSGVPDFTDVPWLAETPAAGTLAPGQSTQVTLTVDTTGLAPGVYGATVVVVADSGRQTTRSVPIRLVVPAYQASLNSGGDDYRDGLGDTWAADQPYTPGGVGYLADHHRVVRTQHPITGTTDQALYQNQAQGVYEYRFDNVPNGVYEIDLRFAELRATRPNSRLFDVIAEDDLLIPALDVANTVGDYAALDRTLYVKVTDGQLNVRLISRKGDTIINAIRVTQRPDRTG